MDKIPFNLAMSTGNETSYIEQAILSRKLIGDGYYSKQCEHWFKENMGFEHSLMVTSCTHALEIAAILLDIHPGDEVIMPSYTFVSTANAFVLRGAKVIFVDIDPKTMNIDEDLIESAITDKTKAIVVVHYAGICCDMTVVCSIAKKHGIYLVEDAAQAMMSTFKESPLGGIGDISCFSFHGTKNYTSGGEGGLVVINNYNLIDRSEVIREKGTNRRMFFKGKVDKYTWVDIGSSYLPSEIQCAYLLSQLESAYTINEKRLQLWKRYQDSFSNFKFIETLSIPKNIEHNAHMFFIKLSSETEREKMMSFLNEHFIESVFHYIPLHSSPAGKKYGFFHGDDNYTTKESERILRLPMYYDLTIKQVDYICSIVKKYFEV
ncbi:dTDP-4-amino-4,6-dideoxygalactose transaminase [Vibrio sp. 99-8-1]|uniref:dTDP-4-amino-4,6-dideoxygalactose transaminase n=1 Tax=Vibrio sp. 99-8-1 TaxID=2607602 RepID=UPI001493A154|nr:dTDP-4-amino-4,6-dideoxygalactose transaminase [Vibrio sp. 99-8-1]NOI68716.1 dTDP-4-amino-4,6-dideoxygalactose transaminase [Vibrio sp. 99-8-1]